MILYHRVAFAVLTQRSIDVEQLIKVKSELGLNVHKRKEKNYPFIKVAEKSELKLDRFTIKVIYRLTNL